MTTITDQLRQTEADLHRRVDALAHLTTEFVVRGRTTAAERYAADWRDASTDLRDLRAVRRELLDHYLAERIREGRSLDYHYCNQGAFCFQRAVGADAFDDWTPRLWCADHAPQDVAA